jgi:hypothetical protein
MYHLFQSVKDCSNSVEPIEQSRTKCAPCDCLLRYASIRDKRKDTRAIRSQRAFRHGSVWFPRLSDDRSCRTATKFSPSCFDSVPGPRRGSCQGRCLRPWCCPSGSFVARCWLQAFFRCSHERSQGAAASSAAGRSAYGIERSIARHGGCLRVRSHHSGDQLLRPAPSLACSGACARLPSTGRPTVRYGHVSPRIRAGRARRAPSNFAIARYRHSLCHESPCFGR